jgi:hypothetical protein
VVHLTFERFYADHLEVRVALNLATSQLRHRAAEARAVARSGLRRASTAAPPEFEDAEPFWQLVRRLPPQQARVVALYYAADRSVAEVAEVLGLAEGTVKAHLHKAPTPWRRPALAAFAVLVVIALVVVGARLVGDTGLVIDPVGPVGEPGTLPVPGVGSTGEPQAPVRRVWLARATGDGTVQLRQPALPVDGPTETWPDGVLPVPAAGEVLAVYGWERVPLFVVADEDRATLVFDATSPRHPTDLLGWCPDEGRFVDGSGARYDRSGQAVDSGAPMYRYDHAVSELGRGDLRALRLLWGAGGWQPPRFVAEATPRSAAQVAPCGGRRPRPGGR